jgi:hypothetical protein
MVSIEFAEFILALANTGAVGPEEIERLVETEGTLAEPS